MFKSCFKIARRTLLKDLRFTILNLIGLSTGLACTFFIFLWVSDERGINRFNDNDARLYQVMLNMPVATGIQTQEYTPGLLSRTLKKELPEIEYAVSVKPGYQKTTLTVGDRRIQVMPMYVDSDFLNVFSYRLIDGNKSSALANKNALLLSEELANSLFHTTTAVAGRSVTWGQDSSQYIVTGVFKVPENATGKPDLLLSYQSYYDSHLANMQNWQNSSPFTYITVKKGTDIKRLNNKLAGFIQSKDHNAKASLFTRRFSDSYLYDKYENGKQAGGRIEYVKLFSIIAIFILLIACINFMNLSTAKAAHRLKDAGIRKIMGADRLSLVLQYLSESLLLTFLAFGVALALVVLFLPVFNSITQKHLSWNLSIMQIICIIGIGLLTGLLAGSYPALYISGFKPVSSIKGNIKTSLSELWIRKGLVVFQFTVSTIFVLSVLAVYRQMHYVQEKNLGYNKDNIVSFQNEGELSKHLPAFIEEAKKIPGVINAASFRGDLTGNHSETENIVWEEKKPDEKTTFAGLDIDYGLMDLLDFKMTQGRTFSKAFGSDSTHIIFNETAIAEMGLADPIGKTVRAYGKSYQIIGVAKDFHFESLYKKVTPCFMRYTPAGNNILVKIKAGNERDAIAQITGLYKSFNGDQDFSYHFLDEDYQKLYFPEQRVAILSRYFAGLAIIISCLGLFGLVAFTAQKRQKEIGIRKTVGAMAGDIVLMLSKDFLKLTFIATLIALPIAWWIIGQWLNNFAYHIPLGAGIFIITTAFVMVITILTVGFQAARAALVNPIKSLRTE